MADGVPITAGAGTTVATDEVNLGAGLVHLQRMKLTDGTDGGTEAIPGSALRGLAVEPRLRTVRLSATPVISTTAYAAKDAIGGLLTFTGAARTSGGSIRVEALQLVDQDQEMRAMDLVLFDRSITAPTDNAAFDPTDTELGYVVGVIPITAGLYADFNDNAVATLAGLGMGMVLNGSNLYGVLVSRDTPTYTSTSDLVVTLTITQD